MTADAVAESSTRYAPGEWETRVDLAATYRIVDLYGMSDIANQEIAARVKGEPDCFLIHPYGLLFDEVRASDFVKVRLDGTVVDGAGIWFGSGQSDFTAEAGARWVSDGAVNLGKWIFGIRADVDAFIHGHCEDVMAVSATGAGLRAVSQAAIYLSHLIAYLDYDFFEDDEYAELFMKTIRDNDIIVSHHHGYYTVGSRPSEAFFRAVLPAPGLLSTGQGLRGRGRCRRPAARGRSAAHRYDPRPDGRFAALPV